MNNSSKLVYTNSCHLLVNLQGQDKWTGVVSGSKLDNYKETYCVLVLVVGPGPNIEGF